jgi:NADPH-dependent ferric siderophore reductase
MLEQPQRCVARQRALGTVVAARTVTPRMRRITLGGEEIAEFVQGEGMEAPAAWVKLIVPSGEGRAYTLRKVDRRSGTLDIDFVLHVDVGDGPGSRWAAQARVGERVSVAGPRSGGFAPPADVQWLLLAGDATSLPAIQSIALAVPSSLRVEACVEVHDERERQVIDTAARWRTDWVQTASGEPGRRLCQQMLHRPLLPGPGYLWLAAEASAVQELKRHFLARGIEQHRLSAKGYWKRGEVDHRD